MKKTIKKTMVKKATAKKAAGKKPMMQKGGVKKSLPKAQTGKQTPFQEYMRIPGAVASDTTMQTLYPGNSWDAPKPPVAKNPKNQKALEIAFDKTYGYNWKSESGQPAPGETFEQYKRRMGPNLKKGGATKAKKVVKPMMKAGGSTAGKTTPLYSNNPKTQQGRTLKKGGTTSKTVSSRMKKGGTVKRKK